MRGKFLEQFFRRQRGGLPDPNSQGEIAVLCPFPHDKGFETNPSAHIRLDKGLFHCKTCRAEGRFNDGGLSEIGFISEYYQLSYEEALEAMTEMSGLDSHDFDQWHRLESALSADHIAMYANRGIAEKTLREYHIGYSGDGLVYPVLVYGVLCDIRTYNPDEKPKMRSKKGASPLLFPFDSWREDSRPTLLVGGENDCLIGRQIGFNALTVTGGEGSFPSIFLNLFKGKKVYICYDCDEAGKKGSKSIAFKLKEAGADVFIVDLGLPGTKDCKDLTDYIVQGHGNAVSLRQLIEKAAPYSQEEYMRDKDIIYPVVDLWRVPDGRFAGQRISSRVILSGIYDMPMHTPSAVEWTCNGKVEGNSACERCPLNQGAKNSKASGWWTLGDKNLADVLRLTEVTENVQRKTLQSLIGMPDECPRGHWDVRAHKSVYKVIFTPDVETENDLDGFRSAEQYAYMLGITPEDGNRYRAYFRPFAHPKDGQRVYAVVDRVEPSDNVVSTFKINEGIADSLKVFQGDPKKMMRLRAEMAKDIVGTFAQEMIVYATDIMYHSPLEFKFHGRKLKGYPEGLIAGESRTGKSDTVKILQRYYGIGNYTAVKGATTANLLGGADKLPNGGHKVRWGIIPTNHKGFVFLDEVSGMYHDVISSLTDMRSSGIATVAKIARGKAPAQTRLLWAGNPRPQANGQSTNVQDYPNGVHVILELVGSDEDIARYDFIMLIAKPEKLSSPLEAAPVKAHDREIYRNLIYWAWSRTAEQIQWDEGVEAYVWQVSQELNEKYDTDVKFFGAEAWKKLARIAVACAAACFSCTSDYESIFVRKDHIDWAARFLVDCYDNRIFRLAEYAAERRMYNETNDQVNIVVAKHCQRNPLLIKALINTSQPFPKHNLQAVSGLDNQPFNDAIADLSRHYCIMVNRDGMLGTRRLRRAVEAYKEGYTRMRMTPLSQKGGSGI